MHESILVNEVLELLQPRAGGVYVDGTVGSGGHAAAVLERMGGDGFLLGIDRDEEAIERSTRRLRRWKGHFRLVHGNYVDMAAIMQACDLPQANGVLLDLGVSSEQLDTPERGFSFNVDARLDMRMNQSQSNTAADLVNQLPEDELVQILREFGEEKKARVVARRIVAAREKQCLATTGQLAEIVSKAVGGRRGRIHPATRTFQALRIAVNGELDCLERGLDEALSVLSIGGRLAAISFHRLEDRRVKHFARDHAGRWESLPQGGAEWRGNTPPVRIVTRRPLVPGAEEILRNPRARSAKLRAMERIDSPGQP